MKHHHRFDEVQDEQYRRQMQSSAHWVKGGFACQAQKEPARRRCARLVYVVSRACRYKCPADVARAVEPRLAAFIRDRQISLVCGDNLRRTIVRWIHNHPAVHAAYLTTACTDGTSF